ncbi:hypothetical protein L1I79_29820 [Strepomyces sp. STD 3.1]|nr:hypothetical protein [Streptomyces sp. STD 3.1]
MPKLDPEISRRIEATKRAGQELPITINEDGDLSCPECGGGYIHAIGVTVHSRREDSEGRFLRTSTTSGIVTVEEKTAQPYTSSRRGSIETAMACEWCGLRFSLVLRQHKGVTNMFAVHSAQFTRELDEIWPVGEGY